MFIAFACQCYSKKSQNWSEQELNLKQQQKRVKIWFYKIMQKKITLGIGLKSFCHRYKNCLQPVNQIIKNSYTEGLHI